jgi:hypothetical protein
MPFSSKHYGGRRQANSIECVKRQGPAAGLAWWKEWMLSMLASTLDMHVTASLRARAAVGPHQYAAHNVSSIASIPWLPHLHGAHIEAPKEQLDADQQIN